MRISVLYSVVVALLVANATSSRAGLEPKEPRAPACREFAGQIARVVGLEITSVVLFRYMMNSSEQAAPTGNGAAVECDGTDVDDKSDRVQVYRSAHGSEDRVVVMASDVLALPGAGRDHQKALRLCIRNAQQETTDVEIGGHRVTCMGGSIPEIRIYRRHD